MRRWPWVAGAPARAAVVGVLRGYRRLVSPMLGQRCRFHPSCSAYAIEAVRTHGAIKGVLLATWRVLRCSPLSAGGPDPVPDVGRWISREAAGRSEYDAVIREA